jgi:hypothetical protein
MNKALLSNIRKMFRGYYNIKVELLKYHCDDGVSCYIRTPAQEDQDCDIEHIGVDENTVLPAICELNIWGSKSPDDLDVDHIETITKENNKLKSA